MANPYIAIARPDHWFKNVFMLPGMVVALAYTGVPTGIAWLGTAVLGIMATCLVASANYVINEWLDAEFDKYHPVKKDRPSVTGNLKAHIVYAEYLLLSIAGLALAACVNRPFLAIEALLLIMGVIYNVRPLRTKEKPYLDVLSESVNNPIRFMLGWLIANAAIMPPSSILVAYWMGGAFLMGTKRFAEYRYINDPATAVRYRRSFQYYNEKRLLVSVVFYALCTALFLGVFLVKYRIELLISFPFIALLFTWYLGIGFDDNSIVQTPEKLYRKRGFMAYVTFLCVLLGGLFVIDIPALEFLLKRVFE